MENIKKRAERSGFIFDMIFKRDKVDAISISFCEDNGDLTHFFVVNDDDELFDSFLKEIFSHNHEKVCFDMRVLLRADLHFKNFCDVIDMSLVTGAENDTLFKVANKKLADEDISKYIDKRQRFQSHINACKTAKIDLNDHSLVDLIPSNLLVSICRIKNEMLFLLKKKHDTTFFREVEYMRAKTLFEIECNGIKVDTTLSFKDPTQPQKKYIDHLNGKVDDSGFVYAKFIPEKSKTGRVQTARGSFQCMNINKSEVRRTIISRFEDGYIASVDLNAADYRCVVSAVNDDHLSSLYSNSDDFHDRTVELVFGEDKSFHDIRRKVVKYITYFFMYGGTIKNIAKSTGLAPSKIEKLIKKMSFMDPIEHFKKELFEKSKSDGFVTTFSGTKIDLDGSEHSGKVMALYAQSCTNDVFMDAVINVHESLKDKRSVILFPVHDEIVMDVSPEELELLADVIETMELGSAKLFGTPMKAKLSLGKNYWELERYD